MGVALARVVEQRNPFSFWGGGGVGRGSRLEGRRPLESPGYGWENSTGMRLK
jgi:hypothetical protein